MNCNPPDINDLKKIEFREPNYIDTLKDIVSNTSYQFGSIPSTINKSSNPLSISMDLNNTNIRLGSNY